MNSIPLTNIIGKTAYAYLVSLYIDEKNWVCWIPKNILTDELRLLKAKQNTVLIMKNYDIELHKGIEERKIFAKYFMEILSRCLRQSKQS